ncbi:histidine phosphatase superfamily [Aspergillus arachidicola]|uniref:Histidine phosphatase superfamily n=1 Tax=Aspergillus arachidicola TaxID=656916 RepID=A0A5N6XSY6_9EURO|nr:histidine phosphatase superfamily [Aspergillus arachidicola]
MWPIVRCVRHAQGVHNLSHATHHLSDPELTFLGEEQARTLGARFPTLDNIQLILSSPQRRAIQTALLAFSSQVQEASGLICDTGRDLHDIQAEFEKLPVDFALVEPGWHIKQGKWAPVASRLLERAQPARQWLSQRPEKEIVVVSHGCFLHFLTDDWVNAVNSHATDWANAEVRSFAFANDVDESPALCETIQSRERRGLGPVALTKEQQLELQQMTLQIWIEWGVILA